MHYVDNSTLCIFPLFYNQFWRKLSHFVWKRLEKLSYKVHSFTHKINTYDFSHALRWQKYTVYIFVVLQPILNKIITFCLEEAGQTVVESTLLYTQNTHIWFFTCITLTKVHCVYFCCFTANFEENHHILFGSGWKNCRREYSLLHTKYTQLPPILKKIIIFGLRQV